MNDHGPAARGDAKRPDSAAELLSFAGTTTWRRKWLILSAVVAVTAMVFAVSGTPSPTVWTAIGAVRMGTMPRIALVGSGSCALMEQVEDANTTFNRLNDPSFRGALSKLAAFAPDTRALSEPVMVTSLRGVVLNDRDLRIEVSGASRADATAAMAATVAEIQRIHGEIARQRIELVNAAAQAAEKRLVAVKSSLLQASAPGGRTNAGSDRTQVIIMPSDSDLASTLNLAIAEKSVEPTRIMDGTQVSLSGPQSTWRLRAALLAGLGTLIAAVVLTLAVTTRSRS